MESQNKNNENNNKKRNHGTAIECSTETNFSSKRPNNDKGSGDSSSPIYFDTMEKRDNEKFLKLLTSVHEKSFDERMIVTGELTFEEVATAYGSPYFFLPSDVQNARSKDSITSDTILSERNEVAGTAVTEANKQYLENHSSSDDGEDDGSADDDDDYDGYFMRNSGTLIDTIPVSHSNFIKSLPYSPILEIMKTTEKHCKCPCGKYTKPWKTFIGIDESNYSFDESENDKNCSANRSSLGLMEHLKNNKSALHIGVHFYLKKMINKNE